MSEVTSCLERIILLQERITDFTGTTLPELAIQDVITTIARDPKACHLFREAVAHVQAKQIERTIKEQGHV